MTQITMLEDEAAREGLAKDCFQTPDWAVEAIAPMLPREWRYWEPCAGKGNIVRCMRRNGFDIVGSDIRGRSDYAPFERVDYLQGDIADYDAAVTNPPYSCYGDFLRKAFEYGKPFAFLLPDSAMDSEKRYPLIKAHGADVSLIYLPERVRFETPRGRTGADSKPQCMVFWLCYKMPVQELRGAHGRAVWL